MGSLVECHMATSYAYNGSSACAGVYGLLVLLQRVMNVLSLQQLVQN